MQRSQLSKSVTQSKYWCLVVSIQLERPRSCSFLPSGVSSGSRPFFGSTSIEVRWLAPVSSTQFPMPSLPDLVSLAGAARCFSIAASTTLASSGESQTRSPIDSGRCTYMPPKESVGHIPRRSGSPQAVFFGT